jgi:hypothetical protein
MAKIVAMAGPMILLAGKLTAFLPEKEGDGDKVQGGLILERAKQ